MSNAQFLVILAVSVISPKLREIPALVIGAFYLGFAIFQLIVGK